MPRVSTIATHKHREKIEKAILDGETERAIAARFKVGKRAIHEYKRTIADQAKQAILARGVRTIDYLQELEDLRQVAIKELREALAAKPANKPLLFTALKHAGDFTERLARFTGQSQEKTGATNIQINLYEVMPTVHAVLQRFPEARDAVQKAIEDARSRNGQG
jgi:hypothetical protein